MTEEIGQERLGRERLGRARLGQLAGIGTEDANANVVVLQEAGRGDVGDAQNDEAEYGYNSEHRIDLHRNARGKFASGEKDGCSVEPGRSGQKDQADGLH